MSLLLDTSALIFWFRGDPRIGPELRHRIEARAVDVRVSAAGIWEASIKRAKGQLNLPEDFTERVIAKLPVREITATDGWRAGALPPIHKDPFDRVIVAQALNDDSTIVTSDSLLGRYGVKLLLT